jgi:methylenetetrahydrofolate dehydrogenase (NADP+)/methenyltetrahydrofolate cyclohydrolase
MSAHIIDGKAQAARWRVTIAGDVAKLVGRGIKPGLAVVLVGSDPASLSAQ